MTTAAATHTAPSAAAAVLRIYRPYAGSHIEDVPSTRSRGETGGALNVVRAADDLVFSCAGRVLNTAQIASTFGAGQAGSATSRAISCAEAS